MKAEEWALLDRQVLGVIRLTLSRSVAHNVVKEKTTRRFDEGFVRWEAMRMTVSNSTGKEKLKYNDIRDLILAEEIRRRDAGETSGSGSALNLETRGREANLDQANKYNAGIVGKQVTLKGNAKSPKKKNEDDSANAVTEEVQDALLLAVDSPLDDWVLDSGASFHTTPHREIIQNYVADVRISLPNGSVWLLEKVRHIPDLKRNLISVGQLDDEGHAILFVGGTWKVTKGARVLARGKKTGTLYMTSCPRDTIAVADASTDTSLWHRRLGHMNNGGEYIDGGFSEYCAAQGIRMEKTIPGTPQQNAYLINRGPLVPMEFRLPEEVWSGKEVWDEQNRKIIRSRNVIFNEQVMYKDRSTVTSDVTEIDQKKSEFVNLDELTESIVQKGGEEDKENVNSQVDLSTPIVEVRRSSRNTRPPQRYSPVLNYLLLTDGGEPECYDEALQDENSSKWELAMKDEMDSLLGNQTWQLTKLPVGKKALHNKWVYRIKNEHDGSKRYKARLVVKGFQQKEGIDYTEIFSPVVKMSTIRLVLGMVAAENLHLEQLDVKTAFLHGDLEEDLYMIQPEGFIVQGQENLVCKLRKSLYGLKQAPRQWYKKFDNFMHRIGFKRCESDHCCYVKSFDNSYIILLLYVDDMLIVGSDIEKINNLKKQLSK
ncbi:Retrovirus-related Pol polyprotein from transposon TNT 1-94 [Vitis vinifera]|uniref:Retrovirus-related Pol polyprotein from transposon TNT 1-94 n=1 Tax=Vitis vinifera TaxID=29760 RepID=A0A438HHG5_VITVI|nr:Retrovirus-related Pol polyprotein from transposon TNT 1-94 [Vitis vinifera]